MLKPLGDRVVIRVAKEEEKTVGGIVLASVAKEKPQTGEVIAVGDEGVEYLIVSAKDIIATVE